MEWARERWALWRTRRWVTARDVRVVDPLPGVELRAVMVTWNEADIVRTTVANCFEQGCTSVHVVDNGSDDGTAEAARSAGAVVEASIETAMFEPDTTVAYAADVVERVSRGSGAPHVWWLCVDADELVEGPDGRTIASFAADLDRSHRVVGSRTINHYPRRSHPLAPGEDPRRVPTNAQERRGSACRLGHWKHPLVRWDAAGPALRLEHGFHVVGADHRLVEPQRALVAHHYPYRARAVTEARLAKLAPRLEPGYEWAMGRRLGHLDAIYREAYDECDPFDMVGPRQSLAPTPSPPVRPA